MFIKVSTQRENEKKKKPQQKSLASANAATERHLRRLNLMLWKKHLTAPSILMYSRGNSLQRESTWTRPEYRYETWKNHKLSLVSLSLSLSISCLLGLRSWAAKANRINSYLCFCYYFQLKGHKNILGYLHVRGKKRIGINSAGIKLISKARTFWWLTLMGASL